MGRAWSHPEAVEGKVELGSRKCFFGIQGAPSSAGMCPPRTPALLRGAGTTLKSAKTGAIGGSESLNSAGMCRQGHPFCACPFRRGTCCRCGAFCCRQLRCRRYREASRHMSPGNRGHHGLLAKRPAPGTVHVPHKACCAPTLEGLHQNVQYAAVLYCTVLYPYWCLVGEG